MTTRQKAIVEFVTKVVSDSITRPSNTTQYNAGDVVSDATDNAHFTFAGVVPGKPWSGLIDCARITSTANQSTLPNLELWLFHTDISTTSDNAKFLPTDTHMLRRVGIISFDDWTVGNSDAGADGNSCCEKYNLGIPFRLGGASSAIDSGNLNLYGQLVARNSYTPVSGEVFTVELVIYQD